MMKRWSINIHVRHAAGEFDTIFKTRSEILSCCCCCIPLSFLRRNIKWALRKDTRLNLRWPQIWCREIHSRKKENQEMILIDQWTRHLSPLQVWNRTSNIQICWIQGKKQSGYNAAGWRTGGAISGSRTRLIWRIYMQPQCLSFL